MSLRSSVLRYLENDLLRFLLWLGPITIQRLHHSQGLSSDVLKPGAGYGIALATASHRYRPFRLELVVFLISKWKGPSIAWDAGIVDLASCGDVEAMKGEFSKGHATALDVLPDGLTLLHVCFRHCLPKTLADTNQLAASQGHFDMVKFLLQEGARVNAMNDFGE